MSELISVIIPTYRRSDFLIQAVDSVLAQDYDAVEIIVVDDNPPDSDWRRQTEQAMHVYEKETRVRYVKNDKNIGGAAARNRGARLAEGTYLCFLDDDDIYLPNKLSVQSAFMRRHRLDVSFTDMRMENEDGRVTDRRVHDYVVSWDRDDLLTYHLMHHLTPTDCYMFTREGFLKAGGFVQGDVSQDFYLMLSAIERGLRIGYLPGEYAVQHIHSRGSLSQNRKRLEGDKKLYEVKKRYFGSLTKREIRYIRFRYNAVLAVYFLRNRRYGRMLCRGLAALMRSPAVFVREGAAMLRRLRG